MEQRKEEEERIYVCVHISSFDHLTHSLTYSVRDNILTHPVYHFEASWRMCNWKIRHFVNLKKIDQL